MWQHIFETRGFSSGTDVVQIDRITDRCDSWKSFKDFCWHHVRELFLPRVNWRRSVSMDPQLSVTSTRRLPFRCT